MSRKSLPFAIVPILVNGETTGHLIYKSGQFTSIVKFEVQCIYGSMTEKTLVKTFKSDYRKVSNYVSDDNQWIVVYEVTLQLSSALAHPKTYLLKVVRSLASCITRALEDEVDVTQMKKSLDDLES